MQFEAELRGKKYRLHVQEDRDSWTIVIENQDPQDPPRRHTISKTDYATYDQTISFLFQNSSYLVDVVKKDLELLVYTRGSYRTINLVDEQMLLNQSLRSGIQLGKESQLTAGMPGKIIKLHVAEGDQLKAGDPILVMEAMKMENELRATRDVKIKAVKIEEGQNVEAGATLVTFE